MNTYTIKVIETYTYDVDIEARHLKEALDKVEIMYDNDKEGIFVADATTYKDTKFRVVKEII